jgi:hypothetical protein
VSDFRVQVSRTAPVEAAAECELVVSGGYGDTIPVPVLVGDSTNLPAGPDAGGYRIYDYTDSCYAGRPDYDWVELRGVGTPLVLGNDETCVLPLPPGFGTWRWYGVDYDSISVCSNGWVAAGATDRVDFVTAILPYEGSPGNILAFLWNDLDPTAYGSILYAHDEAGHRLVVEFDSIAYFGHTADWEKVQVQIYDQSVSTPTGDNAVVIQYATANYCSTATVAFQNQSGTLGLTHVWNTWYPRVSAPLRAMRALRIQTDASTGTREEAGRASPPSGATVSCVPNPGRGEVEVRFAAPRPGEAGLSFVDATGRLVLRESFRVGAGPATRRVDLGIWASGVYLVRLVLPGATCEVRQVIVD